MYVYIILEEFYPPGLNYSIYPTYASGYETSNDTGSNTNTEFADLFSARYEATQVRQPQSDYILKSRDNVILIPPTLPNNLPSMSTTTEQSK
ncbi:hypothetical protein EON63_04755 [archaeon]|nr:MAG: hypothetical protein EON63_04755 [archaeon]